MRSVQAHSLLKEVPGGTEALPVVLTLAYQRALHLSGTQYASVERGVVLVQADLILLHFTLLHFTDTASFHKLKVSDSPALSKSIGTIFRQHLLILGLCITFWQFSHCFTCFHYYYICYGDL